MTCTCSWLVRGLTTFRWSVFALALGACATDKANRYYVQEKYAEKAPGEVQILWKRPDAEFIVIADFQSRGETAEDMRAKAAKIGADAVIVAYLGGIYTGEEWASQDRRSASTIYTRLVGTAIKFKRGN